MAKGTVDGETQPKKKMSKKRKFLIALGVIAGLLVGAWVLVVTPAINKLATEQLQAAGLEGAIVEIRADGAKLTLPTLPASVGGGDLMASNLVIEFGFLRLDCCRLDETKALLFRLTDRSCSLLGLTCSAEFR